MANAPGGPPPLLPAPNQFTQPPPVVPWRFPPPITTPPPGMIYPNAWPHQRPTFPPTNVNAWPYPCPQAIAPVPPFTAPPPTVPPNLLPSFPPPINVPPPLPAFPMPPLPEVLPPLPEVLPPLPAECGFPKPDPLVVSSTLSVPTLQSGSIQDIRLLQDPRNIARRQKDSLSNETDIVHSLPDVNKKKDSSENDSSRSKVAHSEFSRNLKTSQGSTVIQCKASAAEKTENFNSQMSQRMEKEQDLEKHDQFVSSKDSSCVLTEESTICDGYSHNNLKRAKEGSEGNNDKLEEEHLNDRSSKSGINVFSDFRDSKQCREVKGRSRSPIISRSSPDYTVGSRSKDRSNRSPSRSRASHDYVASLGHRDKSIKSRNSLSRNYKDGEHLNDRSSKSGNNVFSDIGDSNQCRELKERSQSPIISRSSPDYTVGSRSNDRSNRSPSRSRASQDYAASLGHRDKSIRSRNSLSRNYKDGEHLNDRSSKSGKNVFSDFGDSNQCREVKERSRSPIISQSSPDYTVGSRSNDRSNRSPSRSRASQDYAASLGNREESIRSRNSLSRNFKDGDRHVNGSSRSRSRDSPSRDCGDSKHRSNRLSRNRSKHSPSQNYKDSGPCEDESSMSKGKNSTSSVHLDSEHHRDRSSRSRHLPSRDHKGNEHVRDRSSMSRNSPTRDCRSSEHRKDRSSKSRYSATRDYIASKHLRDNLSMSRNSPTRDHRDRLSMSRNSLSRDRMNSEHRRHRSSRSKSRRHSGESKHPSSRSSRYSKDRDRLSEGKSADYESNQRVRDRSRSRSRLSDNLKDKKDESFGPDGKSGVSKDHKGESISYPSIKKVTYAHQFPDDRQSSANSNKSGKCNDSDLGYEGKDNTHKASNNHKKVRNDEKIPTNAISHHSKASDHSDRKPDSPEHNRTPEKVHVKVEEETSEKKDVANKNKDSKVNKAAVKEKKTSDSKKPSPKIKCLDPKLKLYDAIWKKVRDKSRARLKLSPRKLPVAFKNAVKQKEKLSADITKDKETEKGAEEVKKKKSSPRPSPKKRDSGHRAERKRKKSVRREKEKIKSPKSIESSDRSERRAQSRARLSENEIQPSLSCEPSKWIESTPAEQYYSTVEDSKEVVATDALKGLHKKFQYELVERADRAKAGRPEYNPPQRKIKLRKHKPVDVNSDGKISSSSGSSSNSSEDSSSEEEDTSMEELEKKKQHPDRLHPELWFNDPNEMNDGPLCRCSAKARRSGIRHGIYVGESHLPVCYPHSNNAKTLYHYKICVTPVTNFLTKNPTFIVHKKHRYVFEGFSMFSHKPLPKLPNCKVIRFNYEYTLMYVEEKMPANFTVAGLELFGRFLMSEILELVDLDWKAHNDDGGCPQFHFMPRFARKLEDDGKELLSLSVVMEYLLKANKLLIEEKQLEEMLAYSSGRWQDLADQVKGMIVTCPGMKPSSVRVDQLDREHTESSRDTTFPVIVHFGVRPPQLSYAGNPLYQKAWRDYVKYRHLLANKPKVFYADRHKLTLKESKLQEMRMENDLKRDVTIVISSKGFYQTGLMSDVIQHAMLLPILVCHLRFHASLTKLEDKIGYKFHDRFLLQLALTHPSYRENFGTNPDHARNSLTNCGLRQPQYGDRRIHYMNTRKRGINTLINIMSRFGNQQESASRIHHNERLEFLGDAVVEFLSSIHLFYMFPDLEEGGLATYRAAIVQNQHLAVLSKKLELETFMLYAHGSDLCHDLELRHAMANCFEALMGALFLDAGIEVADKVFSNTLFPEPELKEVWMNYPLHPLQEQEPNGDRRWIETIPLLQKLNKFEEQIGIEFTHIRLLARALTHRSLGYNNLTLGSNQRLEFLGDTVLQLVASEYLYKFFPQHHEGHLSLLRSSLVNNRTQAVVCGDLGMVEYAIYPYMKVELKPKDKADLLEAFLGALYIDKDLGYCRKFCEVCFFPRLQDFIMNQDWNDPKSKLQQCCLTLRSMDGGEPDIPTYKVIECKGPTNTRVYGVAVYFQGNRLAVGEGHSIQQAEMDAASNALRKSKDLFPQLRHQKRAIERSLKQGPPPKREERRRSKRKITAR